MIVKFVKFISTEKVNRIVELTGIRKRLAWKFEAGRPSDHIHFHKDLLKPGDPVVLYARVSTPEQYRHGNLKDQRTDLEAWAKEFGYDIRDTVEETGAGDDTFRCDLLRAAAIALDEGACLFIQSVDRLLRKTRDRGELGDFPSEKDFQQLSHCLIGVRVASYFHPDTPYPSVCSHIIRRGQRSKNRGGRPRRKTPGYCKKRREVTLSKVLQLHHQGIPKRAIGRQLSIPECTVRRWIKRYDQCYH